jgi:hypothetical protein
VIRAVIGTVWRLAVLCFPFFRSFFFRRFYRVFLDRITKFNQLPLFSECFCLVYYAGMSANRLRLVEGQWGCWKCMSLASIGQLLTSRFLALNSPSFDLSEHLGLDRRPVISIVRSLTTQYRRFS